MPGRLTVPQSQEFLGEPRVAVLSVASDGGRPPHAVPVWYAYQPGGDISFFTSTQGRTARKVRLIERAGVVTVTVQQPEFPYKYVTVEGTVVRADRPPSAEQMLAVVRRYLPEEMAHGFVGAELGNPASRVVLFTVRPERWLSFDFGD
jgi:uncharacterized protein